MAKPSKLAIFANYHLMSNHQIGLAWPQIAVEGRIQEMQAFLKAGYDCWSSQSQCNL